MRYREFGNTRLRVSEIGIGAFPLSGVQEQPDGTRSGWTGTDDRESIALIHRAEELGINLIDSAESYGSGHSEEVVGRALKGRRDRWIVATKVTPNQGFDADDADLERRVRSRIEEAVEGSLRRLQTDVIDLYQLHAIPHEAGMRTVMETLTRLKEQGKLRWFGISINSQSAIEKLRQYGEIGVLQIGYNLLERSAHELLGWARSQQIGTLIRVPLAKGMLTGKYFRSSEVPREDVRYARFNQPESQDAFRKLPQLAFLARVGERTMVQAALKFVLQHAGVSCVIAGTKNLKQIEENAAACDVPELSEGELTRAFSIADTIQSPVWIG